MLLFSSIYYYSESKVLIIIKNNVKFKEEKYMGFFSDLSMGFNPFVGLDCLARSAFYSASASVDAVKPVVSKPNFNKFIKDDKKETEKKPVSASSTKTKEEKIEPVKPATTKEPKKEETVLNINFNITPKELQNIDLKKLAQDMQGVFCAHAQKINNLAYDQEELSKFVFELVRSIPALSCIKDKDDKMIDNIIGEMYNNPDIISQICAESVDLVRRQLEDLGVITAPKAPIRFVTDKEKEQATTPEVQDDGSITGGVLDLSKNVESEQTLHLKNEKENNKPAPKNNRSGGRGNSSKSVSK